MGLSKENLKILSNIISGVESNGQRYSTDKKYSAYAAPYQNTNKEVTVTLGWAQNYGNEGRKLCQMIFKKDPVAFRKADTANIEKMLSVDWVATKWAPTAAQKKALIAIITTNTGKECQDELFYELMEKYVKRAEEFGVTDVGAIMMWCECQHLGGLTPTQRVFKRAAKPYTVDTIFASLLKDQNDKSNNNQIGDKKFQSRHECCVKWIKKYMKTASNSTTKKGGETKMGSLEGLFARLNSDIGYQEKASNAYLDSKSKNAGYNNYQKFSRDINNAGLMGCQAQPWCGSCQFAEEMYEFGVDIALKHYNMTRSSYTAYNVFSTREAFRKAGKYSKTPKLGALVVFKQSHIGRVVGITSTHITTIEGNTSAAYGDRNGGCVKKKVYNRNDSIIDGYCIIDYDDNFSDEANASNSVKTYLQRGDSGSAVKDLQAKLNKCGYDCGTADGIFGAKTESAVIAFQKAKRLTADGLAGKETMAALNTAYSKVTSKTTSDESARTKWVKNLQKAIGAKQDGIAGSETHSKCPTLKYGSTGTVVKLLQQYIDEFAGIDVSGGIDGDFGSGTKNAVIKFQKANGLSADGIVGRNTWKKILKL